MSDDGVPDGFMVERQGKAPGDPATCEACAGDRRQLYLWFGFLDGVLIASGAFCNDCGRKGVWHRYCVLRLRGEVIQ